MPLPVTAHWQDTPGPNDTCGQALFLLMKLQKGIAEYGAEWRWVHPWSGSPWVFHASGGPHGTGSGPFAGEQTWSTTALTPQNTGVNVHYKVPKGDGAWFVSAGGGTGACPNQPSIQQGWGWTSRGGVSGTLTYAGSSTPVVGQRVRATCGGGTTTTNATGDYSFLLNRGTCVVSPIIKPGEKSIPASRTVTIVGHLVKHVDFKINAPLKVTISVNGPIATVGTRSGLAIDSLFPSEGLVNFTVYTYSKSWNAYAEPYELGQKCVSGCANLTITVRDPRLHQPVDGATVTARLGTVDTQFSPDLHQQGEQFLCTQVENPVTKECGADISGTTDQMGQVHLIYWAPGEVVRAHTTITASAEKVTHGTTKKPTTLTVEPYRIYHHAGELSGKEVEGLIKIALHPEVPFGEGEIADSLVDSYIEKLEEAELVSKSLVKAAPWAGFVGYGIDFVGQLNDYWEGIGLVGSLLEASDLNTIGLYDEPFATNVDVLNNAFAGHILYRAGPLVYPRGVLWNLAEALKREYRHGSGVGHLARPEHVELSVYEVSHCDKANARATTIAACGPGYESSLSLGIHTALCFHYAFSDDLGGDSEDFFCIPTYQPEPWFLGQPHVNRALP